MNNRERGLDGDRYKVGQKQQWDSAAAGWRDWLPVFERGAEAVSSRLIEMAAIRPGSQVLDIATGLGNPALAIAQRVGPEGRVVAIDQSARMLAFARERATAMGLTNVAFQEMDAEVLDVPERGFDAIVCRWGLMFLPNLETTLQRVMTKLVPGGRLAAAIWDIPAHAPLVNLASSVAQSVLQLPSPPAGSPSPSGLAGGVLEQALMHAGFVDIRSEPVSVPLELPSVDAFVEHVKGMSIPLLTLLAQQPAERAADYWEALYAALQQFRTAEGTLRLDNTAICVMGQRREE
jgi:SAM-dependent methyltransferase